MTQQVGEIIVIIQSQEQEAEDQQDIAKHGKQIIYTTWPEMCTTGQWKPTAPTTGVLGEVTATVTAMVTATQQATATTATSIRPIASTSVAVVQYFGCQVKF